MVFNSAIFVIFFLCLHVLYWSSNDSIRRRILLIGSMAFYGYWSPIFLFHFVGIVSLNYLFYYKYKGRYTKTIISLILILNFLNLIVFKYFYFFSTIAFDLFSLNTVVLFKENFRIEKIILPLAISFYTFQILAFQIDEYKGKVTEQVSFENFLLFILFFPQLVAGPIMRHDHFLIQVNKKRKFSELANNSGLILIMLGVAKKVIIADNISPLIDPLFQNPAEFSAYSSIIAIYGFAIQIYCDFSGYTDIARGLSLLLGINIPINFHAPYLASSFSDFWRRWHITLSTWLRDYLYIPLGGNRVGNIKTYVNLMITMVLGGLWHGANYTFLIWGGLHGFYLVVERRFLSDKIHNFSRITRIAYSFFVFHLVCFAWIFFRVDSLPKAFDVIRNLFSSDGAELPGINSLANFFILAILLHVYEYLPHSYKSLKFKKRKILIPALGFFVALLAVTLSSKSVPFIYFQF
ncbi:MBOAT family O-acyltransferase [Leptospira interrogans]|uniref:MBOAT family O-acyltransferase n=1 Tax=Leptospira interrogans TaxID=173 RepID=UPI0007748BFB|nr:MBOAT family O-acyltransferase [Leptospira interrogans]KAA1292743.1 MBOAT family protein [Leptospira interrogans serovar Geyaweera]WOT13138.1 MBOAT family O-acyltransferase [Leptospira interrogans]